jgi:hypothetical protein
LAGPLVSQAKNAFQVREAPPAEAAGECPEPLGDAGVKTVRRPCHALLGSQDPAITKGLKPDQRRIVVKDHRGKWARAAVVRRNQM